MAKRFMHKKPEAKNLVALSLYGPEGRKKAFYGKNRHKF
jgi:hypothetical protein